MLKDKKLASACLGAFALLASAAFAQEGTKAPYRVALMVDKTGVLATVIGPAGTGVEAYVEQLNKAGGVNGHPISLDLIDSQSVPAVANGLYQKVLSDPPVALIFFGQSTSQTQSRQLLSNAPFPVLTVTADDSFLYPTPTRTMFQMNASAAQQARALVGQAEALVGDLRGKSLATASVQTTFSDALVDAIRKLGEQKGFKLVTSERFPAGIPSFASQGAKIARLKPDAVIVLAGSADAPIVIKAISDAGVTAAPIIGYAAISATEIFQRAAIQNYYAFRTTNLAAELPDMAAKFKGTRFEPDLKGTFFANGWATGHFLAEALKKCGEGCTGPKLIEAMETVGPVEVPGNILFGPLHFTAKSHAGFTKVRNYHWDGSKVVSDGKTIDITE